MSIVKSNISKQVGRKYWRLLYSIVLSIILLALTLPSVVSAIEASPVASLDAWPATPQMIGTTGNPVQPGIHGTVAPLDAWSVEPQMKGTTGNPTFPPKVVANLDAWTSSPQMTGTTGNPSDFSFTISAGSRRLLVVVVACYDSGGTSGQSFSATYGGKTLIPAHLENTDMRQTWIAYLKETDIANRSNDTVTVTVSGAHTDIAAYIASYQNVDQTTPITGHNGQYDGSGDGMTNLADLTVNANGYGIYGWSSSQSRTNDDEGYATNGEGGGSSFYHGVAYQPSYVSTNTGPTIGWAYPSFASVSFITLNPDSNQNFVISAGTNRLLVVLVACYDSGGTSGQTFSASYGGNSLTQGCLQNTDKRQTWIGYLKESDIASRSDDAITVTASGTHTNIVAFIASYSGVNQSTPITGQGGTYISNTNSVTIGGPLNINAFGYAIYGWAADGQQRNDDTETYVENSDYVDGSFTSGVASKAFGSTTTTNPVVNWASNTSASVSFITLNPVYVPGLFMVSSGTDRLLLIAVSCWDNTGSPYPSFSASYGGKPLTQAYLQNNQSPNPRQTWIGYLKEVDIANRSDDTVSVIVNGAHNEVVAYIASYSGVNQTTPITGATGRFDYDADDNYTTLGSLTVNAGGYGIYVWAANSPTTRTSDSENYIENSEVTTSNFLSYGIASKSFSSTTSTSPTITWGSVGYGQSVSFITLNPANFALNSYTITFDSTGGSLVDDITQEYGSAITAPFDPTREGYTFEGWNPDVPATMPEGGAELTAQWTVNQYTITFDANGGSGGSATLMAYGSALSAPAVTREGHTFDYWDPDVPAMVEEGDATYIAQWTVNEYTITFDSAGGSLVDDITQEYGSAITAPFDPTREGYTFNGWNPVVPATMPLDGAALTAQWTINQYTITFDSDGGSAVSDITQDYGSAVTPPADPTKTGYTFSGWNPAVPATMPLDGAALTAQWTINQYTITFDSDGGSAVSDITQDYGSAVTPPADPTKTGYTFSGWNPVVPATMPLGGAALTAQWTINEYTITFNKNGGATNASPISATTTYNGTVTLPTPPTKVGSTFSSWNTLANGTGSAFTASTQVTASITVYAQWTINTFTLNYTAGAHGSITGTSPQTVAYGGSGTAVTAAPNFGYHFVQWSDFFTANPRTDASVTASINVTASFAITLAPTVVTEGVSSISTTTATGEGNVTADGGSVVTQRGIVWNTAGSPTTAGSKATAPGTTGAYTAPITGLTAGTIYHVRAYAINAMGTSYGSELTFTTLALAPTAVVTATGAGSASFSTSAGTIEDLTAVAEGTLPTAGKPNLTFPFGFFSFKITGLTPGQTVIVTITLPSTVPVGTQYWKYQTSEGGWIQIPMSDDNGDNVITITLVDGGLGDSDGTKDGTILDPGGPGVPPVPVPGVSQWGILALVVLLGSSMSWVIRRKQIRKEAR